MTDYEVSTRITFLLQYDLPEFNCLLIPDIQKQFVKHVQSVYEQDSTLGSGHVQGNLNFKFQDNRTVYLDYIFQCHDSDEAEAESFSQYSVNEVKQELEAFGCKIVRIDCKAGEMDMSWLGLLEDAVFSPRSEAAGPDAPATSAPQTAPPAAPAAAAPRAVPPAKGTPGQKMSIRKAMSQLGR